MKTNEENPLKKILIICSKGTIEDVYAAMRMPGGLPFPTLMGILPGVEAGVTWMMKQEMEKLDIPTIPEFLEMITAGGGQIYACKLASDMFKLKKKITQNM
jgi:peroxiredoxin family protein